MLSTVTSTSEYPVSTLDPLTVTYSVVSASPPQGKAYIIVEAFLTPGKIVDVEVRSETTFCLLSYEAGQEVTVEMATQQLN